jgi:hypothetical protein
MNIDVFIVWYEQEIEKCSACKISVSGCGKHGLGSANYQRWYWIQQYQETNQKLKNIKKNLLKWGIK